jgi:hypothetical protein
MYQKQTEQNQERGVVGTMIKKMSGLYIAHTETIAHFIDLLALSSLRTSLWASVAIQ